jgi:DNA-binding transcriptional LysR family regulator
VKKDIHASQCINGGFLESLSNQLTNQPDLEGVRAFAAIVEAGSFQAASLRLGVPRSTVSHRLAGLEAALGVRLLQRSTRRVTVTEAGQEYYRDLRPALAAVEEATRRVAGLSEEPRGLVRVSVSQGFAGMWMSAIALPFLRSYPKVQLQVDISDRFVDLIGEGYDLAVRGGELGDSSLYARTLLTMRSFCYASPEFLLSRPTFTHPSQLEGEEVLLLSGGAEAEWVFEGPSLVKVGVRSRYRVNSHLLHVEAAVAGLGIARVFPFLVRRELDRGLLRPILPEWGSPAARLQVVTSGVAHRTAAVRAFVEHLEEVVGDGLFERDCRR